MESKTLFLPAPGTAGILVTRRGERLTRRQKKFKDAQAALAWCIEHGAGLVYTPPGGMMEAELN